MNEPKPAADQRQPEQAAGPSALFESASGGELTSPWASRNVAQLVGARVDEEFCSSAVVQFCGGQSYQPYLGYPLPTGEFADAAAYTNPSFFPASSLSYAAVNYPNPSTAPEAERTNDDEGSEYSGNTSDDESTSPSTDSTKKEAFYNELKPMAFPVGSHPYMARSPFETFCTVPGRTSLLSSTTKYKVTIGEIQRRISPPECLNASLLGGILRKAKSKDGGKALRESLRRIGLTLPAGRRKSAHVTALTALVEEEAVHMARDFHAVCQRDFPSKDMAIFLARHVSSEEDAQRRRTMLHYVRMFVKEVSDLMNSDRSPVCANRPDLILDPSIQKPLTHFSMVTHGFGGLVIASVMDVLNSYVHESFKHLDRAFGPEQGSYAPNF